MKTFMMNAQANIMQNMPVLTLGLSSVRSDYQYGWTVPTSDKHDECGLAEAIITGFRKLHTMSSGSFHTRLNAAEGYTEQAPGIG